MKNSDFLDDKWELPIGFEKETPYNIIRFWQRTVREATGTMPRTDPRTQAHVATLLIARLGYKQTMRTLAFMASTMSKYYQYPYALSSVEKACDELKDLMSTGTVKQREGFIGSVGMKDLSK